MATPSRLVDWTCSRLLVERKAPSMGTARSSATSFGPAPGMVAVTTRLGISSDGNSSRLSWPTE